MEDMDDDMVMFDNKDVDEIERTNSNLERLTKEASDLDL